MNRTGFRPYRPSLFIFWMLMTSTAFAADPWLHFSPKNGHGNEKHIVLVSGDEEYRSEEYLPALAKILADRQGFDCTVLFSIDPSNGQINPDLHNNIPGLKALDQADLLIIHTRFRSLPDEQMKHIDRYLMAGKPIIGLRTATHAFADLKGEYQKYSWNYSGPQSAWKDGFGRLVFGETWISHHGSHKHESTRGVIAPGQQDNPLVSGIASGDIWVPTDVYTVRLPLPGDATPVILGQVTRRAGPAMNEKQDVFYGMRPTDTAPVGPTLDKQTGKIYDKNNPMMPVAWTKSYRLPGGKTGHAFCTTMGSATDFTNESFRRLIVNAVYVLLDMKPPAKADVELVGQYHPDAFGFGGYRRGLKPQDYAR